MYSTLPEDALNSTFINFHINPDSCPSKVCNPVLKLSVVNDTSEIAYIKDWVQVPAVQGQYRLPDHEYSKRNVFTSLLNGLEENTLYAFKISNEGWDDDKAQVYYYKNFNTKKMKIVNGGDIGNLKLVNQMNTNVVATHDPDIILVGGDVAYDNNFAE